MLIQKNVPVLLKQLIWIKTPVNFFTSSPVKQSKYFLIIINASDYRKFHRTWLLLEYLLLQRRSLFSKQYSQKRLLQLFWRLDRKQLRQYVLVFLIRLFVTYCITCHWYNKTSFAEKDFCADNKCDHNSQCVNGESNYTCICKGDFAGRFCSSIPGEILYLIALCTKNNFVSHFQLLVHQLYVPITVNAPTTKINTNVHVNQAILVTDAKQVWSFLISFIYFGLINFFVEINECESNPCQNGATCLDQLNGYTCKCPAGIMGSRCHRKK